MRQQGEIIKLEPNQAWVKLTNPRSACGNCQGCLRLSPKQEKGDEVLKLDMNIAARVGDMVIVEYPDRVMLKAIMILYGIPFLGLFLGYFITNWFTKSDGVSGLGAVVGLVMFAIFTKPVAQRLYTKTGGPRIVTKVCANGEE